MAVNVLVKDDVRNALMAAAFACSQITNQPGIVDPESYSQGFRAALVMLALNFGITIPIEAFNLEPQAQRVFRFAESSEQLLVE